MKQSLSLRAEARAIIDEAKRAGRPIGSWLIWGMLSRDVPFSRLSAELRIMQKSQQVIAVPAPPGLFNDSRALCYEPGPVPVAESKRYGYRDAFMGAMEHGRLVEARAAARKWLREGEKAA